MQGIYKLVQQSNKKEGGQLREYNTQRELDPVPHSHFSPNLACGHLVGRRNNGIGLVLTRNVIVAGFFLSLTLPGQQVVEQ